MNLNNIRLRSVAVMTVLQYFANVSVSVLSSGSYSYVHTSLFSPLLELKGVAQFSCIPRCNLKDPWERVGVSAVGKLWRQSREKHVSQKTPRRSVYGRGRRPDRWGRVGGGGGEPHLGRRPRSLSETPRCPESWWTHWSSTGTTKRFFCLHTHPERITV